MPKATQSQVIGQINQIKYQLPNLHPSEKASLYDVLHAINQAIKEADEDDNIDFYEEINNRL